MLTELQELVELHPRNNLNLCLSGGMKEIMALILSHPDVNVRRLACSVLTAATANNSEVQRFAQKQGALNLTQKFDSEQEPALKEAVFGSLSSFLKAENFESKRLFIRDYDGLAFLSRLVCSDLTLKLQKRVL